MSELANSKKIFAVFVQFRLFTLSFFTTDFTFGELNNG